MVLDFENPFGTTLRDTDTRPQRAASMATRGTSRSIGIRRTSRPQHYVTLAKVLKPIQVKVHGAFHRGDPMGKQKRMDHAASLAWLCRFDGK